MEIWKVFDHPVQGCQASIYILPRLSESVAEYAVEFHALAADSALQWAKHFNRSFIMGFVTRSKMNWWLRMNPKSWTL